MKQKFFTVWLGVEIESTSPEAAVEQAVTWIHEFAREDTDFVTFFKVEHNENPKPEDTVVVYNPVTGSVQSLKDYTDSLQKKEPANDN